MSNPVLKKGAARRRSDAPPNSRRVVGDGENCKGKLGTLGNLRIALRAPATLIRAKHEPTHAMAEIKRITLFGKLNSLGYKSVEGATIFCKMRGNPYVETVHWLHQLLQNQDSDFHRILKHFQLDASRLASDLIAALDKLPRGATAISDFSSDIPNAIERGWVYGSLLFGEYAVRTGHLVVGFLNSDLKHKFLAISREFEKIKLEALTDHFARIV